MPIAARRRSKPNPGIGIDLRHPLAAGLVGAWVLNEGCGPVVYNAVRSRNVNNGILQTGTAAPTWTSGRYGAALAMASASTQYVNCGVIPELDGCRQATIFAAGARASGTVWTLGRSGGTYDRFCIFIYSNETIYLPLDNLFDGFGICASAAPTGNFSMGFVFDSVLSNPLRGYINGRNDVLTSSGSGYPVQGGTIPASVSSWLIGRDINDAVYTTGRHDLAFLWAGRALDATEIGDLHDDPWQLFRSPRIFSLYRGAAITITGTAAAGAYSLSGQAAGLLAGLLVGGAAGGILLAGSDAALRTTRILAAAPAGYALAGHAVNLVYTSAIVPVVTPDPYRAYAYPTTAPDPEQADSWNFGGGMD